METPPEWILREIQIRPSPPVNETVDTVTENLITTQSNQRQPSKKPSGTEPEKINEPPSPTESEVNFIVHRQQKSITTYQANSHTEREEKEYIINSTLTRSFLRYEKSHSKKRQPNLKEILWESEDNEELNDLLQNCTIQSTKEPVQLNPDLINDTTITPPGFKKHWLQTRSPLLPQPRRKTKYRTLRRKKHTNIEWI